MYVPKKKKSRKNKAMFLIRQLRARKTSHDSVLGQHTRENTPTLIRGEPIQCASTEYSMTLQNGSVTPPPSKTTVVCPPITPESVFHAHVHAPAHTHMHTHARAKEEYCTSSIVSTRVHVKRNLIRAVSRVSVFLSAPNHSTYQTGGTRGRQSAAANEKKTHL